MYVDEINPYIRRATRYVLKAPFRLGDRVLFDYAMIYVAGGMCDITTDVSCHRYTKGDILLIPPGVRHRFDNVEDNDLIEAFISFDMEFDVFSGQRYISHGDEADLSENERQMIGKNIFEDNKIQTFNIKDYSNFATQFYEIIDIYQKNTPFAILKSKGKLCELLATMLADRVQCSAQKASIMVYSAQRVPIIEQVKNYLDLNYANHITLESLSSYFYMNKYTLIRLFSKTYGISIIQYVNNLKLHYAKKLLRENKHTISEISEVLGFQSIYSFSRFFKNHAGIPPKKYLQDHAIR